MVFEYPLAILLGPVLAGVALVRRARPEHALTPHAGLFAAIPRSLRLRLRGPCLFGGSVLALLLLSVAAARPYSVTQEIRPQEARNIILAIDLSRSMQAEDFRYQDGVISRFAGVRAVVSDFLERRHQDRIGLVVFGMNAFVQSPLTYDHGLIAQLVRALEVGVVGDGTALGDGLGVSVKRVVEVPADSRAVVLLTDGVNTAGSVSPQKAAKVARDLGVTVHTIGIGGDSAKRGVRGAEFDETLLTEIATTTGGTYSNASSVEQLEEIYRQIESLETSRSAHPTEVVVEEHFPQFLWSALIVYAVTLVLSRTVFLKIP
jgi:Ca-activated chloride channel homolog